MPSSALPLTILFATETGDCSVLADFAGRMAARLGLPARVIDAATYNTTRLPLERCLLIITSTHEGQPPHSATDFFDDLDNVRVPLDALRFGVLALGDSAYDEFCAAGRRIDRSLEAHGATRLVSRCEADVWERAQARDWIAQVLALFATAGPQPDHPAAVPDAASAAGTPISSRRW